MIAVMEQRFRRMRVLGIIFFLSLKNIKLIFRKRSNRTLILFSKLFVFGILIVCSLN